MAEHWVSKSMIVPMKGMNHYGTAKLILEHMEKLKKKDYDASFYITGGDYDLPDSVTFRWKEKEEI